MGKRYLIIDTERSINQETDDDEIADHCRQYDEYVVWMRFQINGRPR